MCLINIFDGLPACKVNTCVLDRFFFYVSCPDHIKIDNHRINLINYYESID
jgi:hypothetical protein